MIDVPQVLNLLEIAVSERGADFIYSQYQEADGEIGCRYRGINGQPLCIAGVALNEAGLLGSLVEDNTVTNQSGLVGKVSQDALAVLGAAQLAQDCYETWGEALEQARLKAQEFAS